MRDQRYFDRCIAGFSVDADLGSMGPSLLANGLPPALAALVSATVLMLPLLFLDSLPARRQPRAAMLFALVGLAATPPLLEPQSIVDAANAVARLLFY